MRQVAAQEGIDMTDNELAESIASSLAGLSPADIRPWLGGFTTALSNERVVAVTEIVISDSRYKDAIRRVGGWWTGTPRCLVSWSHVSPETEASLRAAAAWRSAPMSSRNDYARYEGATWTHLARMRLGLPDQADVCREASATLEDRAALNRNGVALFVWDNTRPWPNEVQGLMSAFKPSDLQDALWLVLCSNGRILDGLPTWPRA